MNLFFTSNSTKQIHDQFLDLISSSTESENVLLRKKMDISELDLFIVDLNSGTKEITHHTQYIKEECKTLIKLLSSHENNLAERHHLTWLQIGLLFEIVYTPITLESTKGKSLFGSWILKSSKVPNTYYVTSSFKNYLGNFISYVDYVITFDWISKGSFPLHSAGVIRNNKLYLFSGKSGIGKSTIYNMSKSMENSFGLDEDQVLITKKEGKYFGTAWGYNVKTCAAPIDSVYFLHQASSHRILPSSQTDSVLSILSSISTVSFQHLNDVLYTNLFRAVSTFSSTVNCYNLFFSKSPSFWNLIDG